MWRFNWIYCFVFLATQSCTAAGKVSTLRADNYIIVAETSGQANYLFNHLSKRTGDKSIVKLVAEKNLRSLKNQKVIRLLEEPKLAYDYSINHSENELKISVKNKEIGVWITYQLISSIANEDNRFSADLLPPIIDFTTGSYQFDFEYRDPYFAPNLQPDYASVNGNHNVENSWGLWGHNLSKLFDGSTKKVFAFENGRYNDNQLCFSSPELYAQVSKYILDQFGDGKEYPSRFVIMPNDNDIVCQCERCLNEGNSSKNATPAVTLLLEKLANRFPDHSFFTTAYRTTISLPEKPLPENAGVILSTILLPKGIRLDEKNKKVNNFIEDLVAWKQKTTTIYLWDYASNFDDYLTPFPSLTGMQQQFLLFKKYGVKGVFLNGSGYEYSTFDDLKTYVSGALMMNVNLNVEQLCRSFFAKEYPKSGNLLSDFYCSMEQKAFAGNKSFNIYGGMDENIKTYFDSDHFVRFYNSLKAIIPQTSGKEYEKLKKLFTALSFTRLQLAYCQGIEKNGFTTKNNKQIEIKSEVVEWLDELRKHINYQDMQYKEVSGNLDEYINQWRQLQLKSENQLMDVPIELLSTPDEGFEKTGLLNDGIPGFLSDYHMGWYLSSIDDLELQFPATDVQNCTSIQLRFLEMENHRILPPENIEIILDGQLVIKITEKQYKREGNSVKVIVPLLIKGTKIISLRFKRKKEMIIACDEIKIN